MPKLNVAGGENHSSPGAPCLSRSNRSRCYYGASKALKNISLTLGEKVVTAFIGPSGCGKSTLLRCLNRMNDLIDNVRIEGAVKIGGHDIYGADVDVIELRKRVGMVFQKSNPFPKSIYENVAYGLRLHGVKNKSELDARRGKKPAQCRAVGRSQRPAALQRARFVRRPAAAPVHRPRHRHQAGNHFDGRAGFARWIPSPPRASRN